MSTWCKNDNNGYINASQNNIGQINLDSNIGLLLRDLASNEKYNTILEIGTWNGLGSTKCFIEGFKFRNTPFIF